MCVIFLKVLASDDMYSSFDMTIDYYIICMELNYDNIIHSLAL